jgi:alkylated DNA repair dioxygenase AlkB
LILQDLYPVAAGHKLRGNAFKMRLIAEDGELDLVEGFLTRDERAGLGSRLIGELAWQGEEIALFGRRVAAPRLLCWYGDPGAVYRYSGVSHEPLPWHEALADLRSRIEAFTGHAFNAVLCNRYRTGRDSMGWHADDEPELGERPGRNDCSGFAIAARARPWTCRCGMGTCC